MQNGRVTQTSTSLQGLDLGIHTLERFQIILIGIVSEVSRDYNEENNNRCGSGSIELLFRTEEVLTDEESEKDREESVSNIEGGIEEEAKGRSTEEIKVRNQNRGKDEEEEIGDQNPHRYVFLFEKNCGFGFLFLILLEGSEGDKEKISRKEDRYVGKKGKYSQ